MDEFREITACRVFMEGSTKLVVLQTDNHANKGGITGVAVGCDVKENEWGRERFIQSF